MIDTTTICCTPARLPAFCRFRVAARAGDRGDVMSAGHEDVDDVMADST
jgi:hypothetical protein